MSVIPKVIHQTYKTHTVPDHWVESHESWKALETQGWTYRLWDDADIRALIEEHFPSFLKTFDAYPQGINRADAWRYFVLYHEGGIYVDLDLVCKPNFLTFYEHVKNEQVVLSETAGSHGYKDQNLTNAFMMSQPGAAFWPCTWDLLVSPFKVHPWKRAMCKMFPYFRVLFTTGPGIICDAYQVYEGDDIYVSSARLTQPATHKDVRPYDTKESVLKVLDGSSWHGADAKNWQRLHWFAKNERAILGVLVGLLAVTVIVLSFLVHYWRP